MTFKDYLNEAWAIHPTQSQKIFDEFRLHFPLCKNQDDVLSMGNLIFHISGEHMGKWAEGQGLLLELKSTSPLDDEKAFDRFLTSLKLCNDKNHSLQGFSESDQARILAMSASALAAQNDLERAGKYLRKADIIAKEKLGVGDAAVKALAITGNNLACAIEEKKIRSKEEIELMKLAAHIGRDYWEKAGTWLHVERAEYRLSHTYLKAGEPHTALQHSEACLNIVKKNVDEPLETFFAYEAQALCWQALDKQANVETCIHQMEQNFQKLSPADQAWTKLTFDRVKAL